MAIVNPQREALVATYDEMEAEVSALNEQHEASQDPNERATLAARRSKIQRRQQDDAIKEGGYGQVLNLGGSGPDEIGHDREAVDPDPDVVRLGRNPRTGDPAVVAYNTQEG